MDAACEIVAEAATVTEARHRAERQVPSGMQVLSVKENWPCSGTARAVADFLSAAREGARAQVPPGADVLTETTLEAGDEVSVYAADATEADWRLVDAYGEAVDRLSEYVVRDGDGAGGRVPAGCLRYVARLRKPFVEVAYRSPARVALTCGPVGRRRPHLF